MLVGFSQLRTGTILEDYNNKFDSELTLLLFNYRIYVYYTKVCLHLVWYSLQGSQQADFQEDERYKNKHRIKDKDAHV